MAKSRRHRRNKPNPAASHEQEPFFLSPKKESSFFPIQARPAPKPEPAYYTNDKGEVFSDSAMTSRVGLQVNGQPYLFSNSKGESVSFADAEAGSMAWKDSAGKATEGSIIRLRAAKRGGYVGVFYDDRNKTFSEQLMQSSGADLSPIAFARLSADAQSGLGKGSVINMNNGKVWDLMSFHVHGETKDSTRWVPGSNTQASQTTLGEQSENLPDGLREKITPELTTMAAVSTIEGSFGATSGSSKDDTGSLGIFQWGMKKTEKDNTSSLALFFKKLKMRAATAPAKDANEEQQLYRDAWKACTDKGLDVDAAGYITLNGARATGAQVESTMHGVMGSNKDLRTYQLVAGHDWIEDFKTTKVWPGPAGMGQLGHGFSYGKDSTTFTDGKYTIDVQAPGTASTVGDYFSSDKAVAMAVMLGVNRPHWVSYAVWRALDPSTNPRTETDRLIRALVAKMPGNSAKHVRIDLASATAAGAETLTAYQALQNFLWPGQSAVSNEDAFIAEFQRQALDLYKPADMNMNHREHRFSTVEGAFHE